MPSIPIKSPTNYTVTRAIAFADPEGSAQLVSEATPLPVNLNTASPLPVSINNSAPVAVSVSNSAPLVVQVNNTTPMAVSVSNAAPLAVNVNNTMPMAVNLVNPITTALAGNASASAVVGPFAPVMGRAVILSLAGNWVGTVKLTRSTDGGVTKLPLTIAGGEWANFTGNCCEAVWEESDAMASLYLDITLVSGTVAYRLAQ